jgi:superfamily II DNA/RNA helicase
MLKTKELKKNRRNENKNTLYTSNIKFSDIKIPEFYMDYLKNKMFIQEFSVIQKMSYYPIFNHLQSSSITNDILIKSETGSGKTLAFLLPIILSLGLLEKKIDRVEGTQGII